MSYPGDHPTHGGLPARPSALAAARDLLRDTAELPGEPGDLLSVLASYRRALHDLLRSDPAGARLLALAGREDR